MGLQLQLGWSRLVYVYVPVLPKSYQITPSRLRLTYEDVWLRSSDGVRLHAWFINLLPHSRGPTILFFQENAGNIAHRLEMVRIMLQNLQCNVFMLSYRGYGASDGSPSQHGITKDAQVALDHLSVRTDIDTSRIVVFGRSLGGAVGTVVTKNNPDKVAALIVENTFTSILDMAGVLLPFLKYFIGGSVRGALWKVKEQQPRWRQLSPRTVEEVFRDFKCRRAGVVKALTTDVAGFYEQCDPDKENLCLYGLPNEDWEVNLPAEEVPPELPEPALGINFARDGMKEKDWLSLVAVHSDAWLLAVAFYFGARFGFDRADRKRLFTMINDLPSVFEIVTGSVKRRAMEKSVVSNNSIHKSKSSSRGRGSEPGKYSKMLPKDDDEGMDEEEDEDNGETICGACGDSYAADEFWICCDICEKWFHGKCVKITPARAEHIKHYKCPACSNKRQRP